MRRTASLFGVGVTAFFVMFSIGPAVRPARAADPPQAESSSTPAQRAKQHYSQGEAYFKEKNFSAAMEEYQRGYLEKANPVFIFNIAQCQRLLGNSAAAIEFYQRYLKEAPDGPGRPVAEKQIAELSGPVQAEAPPAPEAAPVPVTPPPAAPPPVAPLPAAATAGGPSSAMAATPGPAPSPPETVVTAPPPSLPTAPPPIADAGTPVYVTAQAQPTEKPVYKTWYFWTAVAALVVSTVIVAAATSSNRPNCDAGRICK